MFLGEHMRLEIAVNQRCNAQCPHCNRAIGLAKFNGLELTAEQMERAVERMNAQGHTYPRITFGGGEPALNHELSEILSHAARLNGLRLARVLTNDMPAGAVFRDRVKFPDERFKWVRSPLDNPLDPKSGKSKHEPFFVSPKDLGMASKFSNCRVKGHCGKGFDACGWSMCGIAGTLGRFLGIDPYTHEGATTEEAPGICEHCIYGVSRAEQTEIFAAVREGRISNPSPTFAEGVKRHEREPLAISRY